MKILGIGNALVDILAKLPDESLLKKLNISKGSMNLIDENQRKHVMDELKNAELKMTTGGSVSNTIRALKQLFVPAGFVGKVGSDHYGKFYLEEMNASGANMHLIYEKEFSGTALCLITPDGERTFTTYLGAAADMRKTDLQEAVFQQYTHVYVEGYLVQNHELIEGAMELAHKNGSKIILDIASYNVVASERNFLNDLIDRYVDILFANEDEASALTSKKPSEAVFELADRVDIVVVKEGDKGSWIKQGDLFMHVPCHKVITPVDTTAAGDYYAAGFLAGLLAGEPLDKCAKIGSLLSYYVIQVIGTKLEEETWSEIRNEIKQL